jgi:hypothetical protein
MSGWNEIDKKQGGSGIGGRIVKIEEGQTVRLRILDEEPYTTSVHKITQNVTKGGKTEEVFRTVPATLNADDSFILKHTNRYQQQAVHNLRCALYKDSSAKGPADYDFKVLQGGPQIFKQLRQIYVDNGHLNQFDVTITKSGSKRDTEYVVSAAPFSKQINVEEATAKLQADPAFAWENLFTPISGEQQKKIIEDAGIDITYDPAAELEAGMSWESASKVLIPFGKFKGKSIGEMVIIDSSYISWAAQNVTTNDEVAAACRVAVRQMAQLESGQAPAKQIAAATQAAPSSPKPAKPSADRQKLIDELGVKLEEKFKDPNEMIGFVKQHGNGKMKLKDFTDNQLNALGEALNG